MGDERNLQGMDVETIIFSQYNFSYGTFMLTSSNHIV